MVTTPLTLRDRVAHYAATFPDRPPMWATDRWIGGEWVGGNNYKGSGYYGAYPPDYLYRVWALFPDMLNQPVMHLFSGSLDGNVHRGVRVDRNPDPIPGHPECRPTICADAQYLPLLDNQFRLVLADTPYGPVHAERYGLPMPDRRKVLHEVARVTQPGGFLVWLDTKLPMFRKDLWLWCGTILVIRSTNHDFRGASIFQRLSL